MLQKVRIIEQITREELKDYMCILCDSKSNVKLVPVQFKEFRNKFILFPKSIPKDSDWVVIRYVTRDEFKTKFSIWSDTANRSFLIEDTYILRGNSRKSSIIKLKENSVLKLFQLDDLKVYIVYYKPKPYVDSKDKVNVKYRAEVYSDLIVYDGDNNSLVCITPREVYKKSYVVTYDYSKLDWANSYAEYYVLKGKKFLKIDDFINFLIIAYKVKDSIAGDELKSIVALNLPRLKGTVCDDNTATSMNNLLKLLSCNDIFEQLKILFIGNK